MASKRKGRALGRFANLGNRRPPTPPARRPGQILVEVVDPIRSPLRDLLEFVPASMLNIAPEKTAELTTELQGVTLELNAKPEWEASYTPAERRIRLSFRVVETLWCVVYAYVVLFDVVFARRSAADWSEVSLKNPPVVKRAMAVLHWAMQDWLDDETRSLPAALLPSRSSSHAAVANDLCLGAVAFILHHELAHHRLCHDAEAEGEQAIQQESDADADAVDWILGGVDVTTLAFTKRAIATTVALLAMTARGVHSGAFGGNKHPRSFDRMFNALDRHNLDSNHAVWMFATVALKLHLDNSEQTPAMNEFESFRDCMDAYVDQLAAAYAPASAEP